MQEGNDSIIDILRREPEQTDFLLKFGIGAPVLIVAWNWVASFFIANIFVVPTTLVLVLVYGGALVYLISRLVHQADRWQVESAMQARRLLTGSSRPGPRPVGDDSVTPPPLPQVNFHQVAFFLNVQEEVLRARREGRAMSVLALDITPPHGELTLEVQDKISFEMAHIVTSQAKVLSHWLSVGPTEFVFSLPNADHAAAKDFVSKLVQALGDYWCHYGLAVYPDEGTDAESLVLRAREQSEESRRDKGRGRPRVSAAYAS
jgi:hypothetical protein